ncbi:MobA/MobL family protein, partial [Curtobacterium flaccumfaciens]|uniref:MobA/MobL family protein n=1 Tax=Curtobacterium flaccumfaciens TaxID=2035 RepID=UPI001BE11BA1
MTTDSPKHKKQEGEQMAIGMLKLRNGSKGKGVAHFNYIMREDKYKPHAEKLEKFENYGHGNMPEWAKDNPKIFWQEADKHERENGRVYKEHIIALPRELNEEQRLELVNDWIKNEIGDKHPYSFAIHTPQSIDGKDQPHVHFMFSQRTHDNIERSPDQFFKRYNSKDPSKGGAKKANETLTKTQSKEKTKEQRLRLGDFINKHLERAGSRNRVDMRNWKEKGLDQKPLNISYKEMKDPTVEKTYKAKFQIQAEQKEIVKEKFQVMGFGQLNAIFKDLEIRIAKEQALKAQPTPKPAEPPQEQPKKSRLGQWGAYRERLAKEKEQEQQRQQQEQQKQQEEAQHKAELIKAQLEKMGDMSKGEVKPAHYEILQTLPAVELDKIKANHEQRAERLEQKAQHEPLTETELKEYSLSKKALNSLDRLQRERLEEAERKAEQPQTFKEFLKGMSKEQRAELKKHCNQVINDYVKKVNDLAVKLYEKYTPKAQQKEPLFAHYKKSDMAEVQPFKQKAVDEIEKLEAGNNQKYFKAVDTLNELNSIEQ